MGLSSPVRGWGEGGNSCLARTDSAGLPGSGMDRCGLTFVHTYVHLSQMNDLAGFDWDDGNRAKCSAHGVSIAEIESLFDGAPSLKADIEHSHTEVRARAVGRVDTGRYVFVVFTIRTHLGRRLIRPVSARYMHRKEVRRYEETRS